LPASFPVQIMRFGPPSQTLAHPGMRSLTSDIGLLGWSES